MNTITIPPALQGLIRDISTIKPYWRNPRKNSAAIDALTKSIETYGFNVPILVDLEGVIIAGHTRYKAALKIGLDAIPCVTLDLPPEKAKEYRIVDNRTSELTEWDLDLLIPEIREIMDIPQFLDDYFTGDEICDLFDAMEPLPDIGNAPVSPTEGHSTMPKAIPAVSAGQVEKAGEKIFQNLANMGHDPDQGLTPVVCPGCGEEFFLNLKNIQTAQEHDEWKGAE